MASSTTARDDRGRATRATDRRTVFRWTSRTPRARVSARARDGTRQIRFISTVARLDVRHPNVGTDEPTDPTRRKTDDDDGGDDADVTTTQINAPVKRRGYAGNTATACP